MAEGPRDKLVSRNSATTVQKIPFENSHTHTHTHTHTQRERERERDRQTDRRRRHIPRLAKLLRGKKWLEEGFQPRYKFVPMITTLCL